MNSVIIFLTLPLVLAAVTPALPITERLAWLLRSLPVGILAATIALLGWTDVFHVSIAILTLLMFKLTQHLKRRTASDTETPPRGQQRDLAEILNSSDGVAPPFRTEFIKAVAHATALVAIVALLSWTVSHIPGLDAFLFDRDRAELELKVDTLEQAGDWLAAANLLSSRLELRTSQQWRTALYARLYTALIGAGNVVSGEEAEALFRQALNLAEEHGLDRSLATTHLERLRLHGDLEQQNKISKDLTATGQQRQVELQQLTGQLTDAQRERDELQDQVISGRQHTEHLQEAVTQMQADLATARQDNIQAQVNLMLEWADCPEVANPLRLAKYREAESLAQQHGISTTTIRERLGALEQENARQKPIDLPAGVQVTVQRIDTTTLPPLTIVDLLLRLPSGGPVTDLTVKDFIFQSDSGATSHPILVQPQASFSEALQLVVLLDCSISTRGTAETAAKTGLADLLTHLQGVAHVKVLSFATTLAVIHDWTDAPTAAIASIPKVAAAGNTALRQAIAQGAADLANRPGPKAMIVFTDGRDTVGGPPIDELSERCRKSRIEVHAIALETAELDRDSLARLTLRTGGTLLSANKAEELPKRFQQSAEALRQPYYRIVLPPSSLRPGELVVGSNQAVRVVLSLSQAEAPSQQQNQ